MPHDEIARIAALRELAILDTAPEQIYDDIVALAATICDVPIALVNLVDADRQWGKALIGLESSEVPREASFCARTIMQDDLMVVPDTLADPVWAANPMVTGDPSLRFYAGATIFDDDGRALGAVCVADCAPRTLDEGQLEALRVLARQTAAHLELRRRSAQLTRANDELRRMAVADSLTGLPNRTLLFDRLGHALAQRRGAGSRLGVLFCDLDGFKAVNDRHGHEAGDTVLREVAARLAGAARTGDTVARMAGDEFVVICPDLPSPGALDIIAARMAAAVARPFTLGDAVVTTPSLSIGGALAADDDTAESALRRADRAMYAVKRGPATA